MPSQTRKDIKPGSDLHGLIINEVRRRVKRSERDFRNKRAQWRQSDEVMVAYVPENEADGRRKSSQDKDGKPRYTTIRVPYAYGVAMSLHAYLVTVFLSRSPVFQFEGFHGEGEDQVLALEALMNYQYKVGYIGPNMFTWLYDSVKYGVGIIGDMWTRRIRHITDIVPLIDPVSKQVASFEQVSTEMVTYEGNETFPVSPYDFLPDPRVTMGNFQSGEFCATRQRLPWLKVKEREQLGYYMNLEDIDPRIKPDFHTDEDNDRADHAIERPSDDIYDLDLGGSVNQNREIKTPELVPVYECFIKLVASDWGLGSSSYPSMWVFTITSDWKVVIGAQPFGAYHAQFPYNVIEMECDAFALANRGIPEISEGVQDTMDWLLNSHFYNVRAALNNLFVVDPHRINMKDLTRPLPGGIIRKTGISIQGDKPIEQLTIADITRANISDMEVMKSIGTGSHGISDILQGQPPQGGRRTAAETRQVSASGTSRSKVISEYMSCTGFSTLSEHMVSNSQQYMTVAQKLKIVGNLAMDAGQKFIMVDPQTIAGKYDFLAVDGTLPIDRFAQINVWKELLQGVLAIPQLAVQYDLGRVFAWVGKLGGLRNIDSFRLVPGSPQYLQNQMAQGNLVQAPAGGSPDNIQYSGGMGPINVANTGA